MAFPTSIELATYFGEAYNNLSTTLSAVAGISDTTIYVASTDNFGSIGWITIEDEVISYTGKTAGSFTGCTRGADNTTAAEHTAGKAVSLTLTAAMWTRVVTELRAALTKLGINSSAVTTSHDYKLSGVTGTDKAVSKTGTETLTNKRNTHRAYSTTSLATLTPEINTYDMFTLTAQAEALNIANHSTSTPTAGEGIFIDITPDATPRALTYGSNYVAYSGVVLPTTTVASKRLQMLFIWLPVGKYTLAWVGDEA